MTFSVRYVYVQPMSLRQFRDGLKQAQDNAEAMSGIPSRYNRKIIEVRSQAEVQAYNYVHSTSKKVNVTRNTDLNGVIYRVERQNYGTKKWPWLVETTAYTHPARGKSVPWTTDADYNGGLFFPKEY